MSSHNRLTMEPFPEKPIINVASTSICTYRVRGEWRRVWGCVTQIQCNSSLSRNCRNHPSRETAQIVCNALTSAHACAEVNNVFFQTILLVSFLFFHACAKNSQFSISATSLVITNIVLFKFNIFITVNNFQYTKIK